MNHLITEEEFDTHDCNTPQGQACQVCAEQFNQIANGVKLVYKESTKTKEEIKHDIFINLIIALRRSSDPVQLEALKQISEQIKEL